MRVYCGLASAGERLTAAVVDDQGQVAAVQQVVDSPEGYSELLGLLATRVEPPALLCVPFACDSSGHRMSQLLVTSGRPVCFVDDDTVRRLAAAEPQDAPDDARRAVAMARGLYAGSLTASPQDIPPQLASLQPVLAAHAALMLSRSAAVRGLREVLRQLYPAALRAFPEPGDPTPLALLDALPDPAQVAMGQQENVVARLGTAGYKDASDALTALRRAVADQPPDDVVLESTSVTVRQTVAAVTACDTAAATLVREVTEWLARCDGVTPSDEPQAGSWPPAMPSDPAADQPPGSFTRAPLAQPGEWAPQPPSDDQPTGPTPVLPSLADQPTSPSPLLPSRSGRRGRGAPPVPTRRPPSPRRDPAPVEAEESVDRTLHLRPGRADRPSAPQPSSPDRPPYPGTPAAPAAAGTDAPSAPPRERPTLPGEPEPPMLDFATDFPSGAVGGPQEAAGGRPAYGEPAGTQEAPAAPPILRSVEVEQDEQTASVTALPPLDQLPRARRGGESGSRSRRRRSAEPKLRPEPPAAPERRARPENPPPPEPPVEEGDSELLIFAAARSAWFAGDHPDTPWDSVADEGWRAAEAASSPSVGNNTDSGLPRRVPQANLVPGSPEVVRERPPISRDASHLAAQTAGYFRGWQRGRQSAGQDSRANSDVFLSAGHR